MTWRLRPAGTKIGMALAVFGSLFAATHAHAQGGREVRIDLHPIKNQVGLVTRAQLDTAWIKIPNRVKEGAKVEFLAFSDGGDTLATGKVAWVSPVAPYEAYITGIKPTATYHNINEEDDYFTFGALTRRKSRYGTRPEKDGNGVYLATGFFARTLSAPLAGETEAIEPVRAHLAALRSQKGRVAGLLAAAVQKALDSAAMKPEDADLGDLGVNYSALADQLRRFRNLRIEDPITARLFARLQNLVDDNGMTGAAVPTDFLRPANEVDSQRNGLGTLRRP